MTTDQTTSRLDQARDPSIAPEKLRELAGHRDEDVRRAVAQNPNVPPELIGELGCAFPDKVLKNPALELLRLEQPGFLDALPVETRAALASSEEASVELLHELGGGTGVPQVVRAAVAANPNTPLEMVEKFAGQAITVRAGAARNPTLPVELLDELAGDPKREVRLAAATNPKLPAEILRKFANDYDEELLEAVAAIPSTPADVLARLATVWETDIRSRAMSNPSTPGEVVSLVERSSVVSHTGYERVVSMVPELSVEDAIQLAAEKYGGFAAYVAAQHPELPAEVLDRLLDHELDLVRAKAAEHPKIDVEVLVELAGDDNHLVRRSVAKNRSCPPDLLAQLAQDRSSVVQLAAIRNPQTPTEAKFARALLDHAYLAVPRAVAEDPQVPRDVLEELFEKNRPSIDYGIANNPSAPTELLTRLDPKRWDRKHRGDATKLRHILLGNPNLPVERIREHAKSRSVKTRRQIATNPGAPADVLARLADSADDETRLATAQNPATPPEVLEALAEDAVEEIARAANHALEALQDPVSDDNPKS